MASMTEVTVPDIGDFDAVDVIEVLVSAGDEITKEQPLIVLESEKATMEVPSPVDGTVAEVKVSKGDKVSQGDLILTLEGGDGGGAGDDGAESAGDDADADGGQDDAGDDEDEQKGDEDAGDEPGDDGPKDEAPPKRSAKGQDPVRPDGTIRPSPARTDVVYAGPAARKLARTLGLDLADVKGTGREGRVTREDVAAHGQASGKDERRGGPAAGGGGSAVAGLPGWPEVDFEAFGPVEREALSRVTRIAGPYLARNWVMIPHVTQFDEADITDLEAFRKEVNEAHRDAGVKVTLVSLLMKACAATLRAFPHFNSSLDGDELVVKRHYHLGFAADTPQGLMVPVIRDVDRKGLLDIARELTELSAAARDGAISREQMQGGTFTVSSLGGIGGTAFTPIVNAPEVAILGVSRSQMKPVWNGQTFVPRLMLPLSLSYDHRVIDGAAGARFTTHLADVLSDPRKMLL
ncbi:MAG: 2-oxo acid dehydrogenase subunit E2 [Thermoleophilia bacterium]|nr:2-oxo acid dehydrogenase subunit E2 [Thermoleophilia bacterium]